MRRHEGERGAALLTVLLLVAIVSVIAATALERLRVSTRLTGNAVAGDQARALAYAAETLAVTKVTDLLTQAPDRVTLMGGWSNRPYPLPFAGGLANARVTDGGNCFNLNSLVTAEQDGAYAANPVAIDQFARLLRITRAPGGSAESIASAAADWIDSDANPLPSGSEDGAYTGGAVPYRTGGTLMADPSELRAVAGVTAKTYAVIRPWICTLPRAEPSAINVNTLTPEQAPLLPMLMPNTLGVDGARQALLKRPATGFGNVNEFWTLLSRDGVPADQSVQGQTAIVSKWFALRIDVTFGGADIEEHGLIDATRLPARLVSRQWGEAS